MIKEFKNKKTIQQIKVEFLKNNNHIRESGDEISLLLILYELDELINKIKNNKQLKKQWEKIILPAFIEQKQRQIDYFKQKIKDSEEKWSYYNNINEKEKIELSYQMSYKDLNTFDKIAKYLSEIEEKIEKWSEKLENIEMDLLFYTSSQDFFTQNNKRQFIKVETEKIEKNLSNVLFEMTRQGLTPASRAKINEIIDASDNKEEFLTGEKYESFRTQN